MRKLSKLLFAAVLAATAFVSAPHKTYADPSAVCQHCANYQDCFSCCRCDGGGGSACLRFCSP
jgi:hypothetical protein